MAVKQMECLDWPAENRPGELLKVSERLAKESVNLDALWAYTDHENKPKIAAIAKKPSKLLSALSKMGIQAHRSQCFCATGKDKPGALLGTFRALADANINITCLDAMATGGRYAAVFWVADTDLAKAKQVLKVQ
jgi:hypothetical protein